MLGAIVMGLLSPVSAKDSLIQMLPNNKQIIKTPLSVRESAIAESLETANRLSAKDNIPKQMNKLNRTIKREKQSIPVGKIRKYDVVTKGTKFISIGESNKPQLRPHGAETATTINIVGGTIHDLARPPKDSIPCKVP